jgi:hypothetical protein
VLTMGGNGNGLGHSLLLLPAATVRNRGRDSRRWLPLPGPGRALIGASGSVRENTSDQSSPE